MEITEELLKTLYKRVEQVYLARRNFKPDDVEFHDDGIFYCHTLDYDREHICQEYISASDLSADLDKIIEERIKQEEIERKANEEQRKKQAEYRAKKEKDERMQKYLELKKEFEDL